MVHIKKILFTFSVALMIIQVTAQSRKVAKNARRPNIILVMSDDMGFSDIGCYGSEIKTPNLDELARHGLRFTQFYNGARCCPTRASLLTGLYPQQAGMGWMINVDHQLPGYRGDLSSQSVTLAQVVKSAGYSTFMAGKWHVSRNTRDDGPKYNWPLQRGFDRFYGTIQGGGNYYDPATLCRDNKLITPFTDSLYQPDKFYYTDALTHEVGRFIKERKKDVPFFLYLAYTAAHWPLHAKPADIAKYKGQYDAGWEVIRENRFKKMKELGVLTAGTELSPLDVKPWTEEIKKAVQSGRMEVYAAQIDAMDQGIGQIMTLLKTEHLDDNTVVIFLQDNGGCAEEIGSLGKTGPWAEDVTKPRALQKDEIEYAVMPRITREGKLVMKGEDISGGPETTYVSYGQVWANVSNTPFRMYKHWVHEGGIATPLIVYYPGVTKGTNQLTSFTGQIMDLMPTLVELTGGVYPKRFGNNDIPPMEGVSLVSVFTNTSLTRSKAVCWEHEMNRAVRLGDWKLVAKGELLNGGYGLWKNYRRGPWELYNMKSDRSELHDLSAKYPAKFKELSTIWDAYAKRALVFPAPWAEVQ